MGSTRDGVRDRFPLLEFSASTASHFVYTGMQGETSDVAWCDADSYFILGPIWKALNSGDRGCITVPTYP